jgi:tetratricopeptide (TPR) repeat protein
MRNFLGAVGLIMIAAAASAAAQAQSAAPANPAQPTGEERNNTASAGALDRLFESLREAASPEMARGIEQVIWSIWLRSGNEEVDRLVGAAILAMGAQDYPAARSHLDQVVALKPDFAEGWNKRATVHFLEGDYARSLEDIRRVLALEPRHFGALSGLGQILERTGRKGDALEAFRRALEIHPQMPAVQQRVEALSSQIEGQDL